MSAWFARRPRVMATLLLITVFIAGVAAGFALDRALRPRVHVRTIRTADMSRVLDALGLTAEQRARADSIVRLRAPATEVMMRDVADRLHSISDSLDAELRSILTPPQRARLDSMRRETTVMLKRKIIGGTTRVDTLFPPSPRTP